MKTNFVGKNCIEVEKTDSTNTFMAGLQQNTQLFEGTLVITYRQEHGRGQRGARWESELGKNLTLSIFLTPGFLKPEEQFSLNKAISLGVMDAVNTLLGVKGRSFIKWPNDIYVDEQKLAGILIENSLSGNMLQHSIVGIGINVNQQVFSHDIPNPISLKNIVGKEFNLKDCLSVLCSNIEKRYLELRGKQGSKIDLDYLESLYRIGKWADYIFENQKIKAKITGLTKSGKLLLENEGGGKLECDFKEIKFCQRIFS